MADLVLTANNLAVGSPEIGTPLAVIEQTPTVDIVGSAQGVTIISGKSASPSSVSGQGEAVSISGSENRPIVTGG